MYLFPPASSFVMICFIYSRLPDTSISPIPVIILRKLLICQIVLHLTLFSQYFALSWKHKTYILPIKPLQYNVTNQSMLGIKVLWIQIHIKTLITLSVPTKHSFLTCVTTSIRAAKFTLRASAIKTACLHTCAYGSTGKFRAFSSLKKTIKLLVIILKKYFNINMKT